MNGFVINLLQTTAIIMFVFFFIYNSSLDKAFLLLHIHSDKHNSQTYIAIQWHKSIRRNCVSRVSKFSCSLLPSARTTRFFIKKKWDPNTPVLLPPSFLLPISASCLPPSLRSMARRRVGSERNDYGIRPLAVGRGQRLGKSGWPRLIAMDYVARRKSWINFDFSL